MFSAGQYRSTEKVFSYVSENIIFSNSNFIQFKPFPSDKKCGFEPIWCVFHRGVIVYGVFPNAINAILCVPQFSYKNFSKFSSSIKETYNKQCIFKDGYFQK